MEIQNLKTFIELADRKNFTKTAQALGIAQSTVTNRIAELEKEIEKKLLFRDNKFVTLTNEGILFLDYAKRIVKLEESCINELHSLNYYHQSLRIGFTTTIYNQQQFKNVSNYIQKHSDIIMKLSIMSSNELYHMLCDNMLDLIFIDTPFSKKGYTCESFKSDTLILVTKSTNNQYVNGITKKQLSEINYYFCYFSQNNLNEYIKELFLPFYRFSFEINNPQELILYLQASTGYSFLPSRLVEPYIHSGDFISIPLLDFKLPELTYYRMYPKDSSLVIDFLYDL